MRKILLAASLLFLGSTSRAQWLPQNAGFSNDTLGFYELSLPDKYTAWAVCYDGKNGLLSGRPVLDFTRTTNGGNTWIPGKMGTDRTLRFSNISAIDGQEAWVAMNKIGPAPGTFGKGGGVFHTTDAGVTWEHTEPGELFDTGSVPRFVHFKDKNKGIAVGDPKGGYFEVYTTMNMGKKWKRVDATDLPAPLPNEIGWISGYAVVGNTIWFGTSRGRMYKSTDFGKNWTVHVVDSIPGTYVQEIAFLDDGLTGVAHLRGRSRTFVFSTTDGGLTWTNYFQPPNWKNSRMTAVPGTNAFVSTAVHPNPIFQGSAVSYDAGRTWTEIDNQASKAVCRFFDAETGYAGSFYVTNPFRGGIFKSQIVFQQPAATESARSSKRRAAAPKNAAASVAVHVYPTPARDVVNLVFGGVPAGKEGVASIHSLDGRQLLSARLSGASTVQLNVSGLPAGLYTLRIATKAGTKSQVITLAK
ncbi:YCF48-related protein [Flaviaesturariibacter amylovorans]|uniref:T9SS type A sorting domain-containing protein n=1 Tax=Flaviaesturariibacter amylovorans TaxID=1084520 RepID=A0ABP8GF04_9BACT